MRVKCLAQEQNTVTRPGLEPEPFDPESTVLITRHCVSHSASGEDINKKHNFHKAGYPWQAIVHKNS